MAEDQKNNQGLNISHAELRSAVMGKFLQNASLDKLGKLARDMDKGITDKTKNTDGVIDKSTDDRDDTSR